MQEATTPSQNLNPKYGYFFWLNDTQDAGPGRWDGTAAPLDMVAAMGTASNNIYTSRSLELVVVRQGLEPGQGFEEGFWSRLVTAMSGGGGAFSGHFRRVLAHSAAFLTVCRVFFRRGRGGALTCKGEPIYLFLAYMYMTVDSVPMRDGAPSRAGARAANSGGAGGKPSAPPPLAMRARKLT